MFIVVKPGYGKVLHRPQEVRKYYDDGHDFEVLSIFHGPGRYLSKRDVQREGLILEVRYGNNEEKVIVLP